MYNALLMKISQRDAAHFTSNFGIRMRRSIHKPWQWLVKHSMKREIIIEQYPELDKDEPYIFASTHSFIDDIITNIASIDRSVYVLIGTTDQLEHNPQMNAALINGLITVSKLDKASRHESFEKMLRVLRGGTSVLLFPEGVWNNTENLLCQKLFPGAYRLAHDTGAMVVPVSCFCEYRGTIYYRAGKPLALGEMEKAEAVQLLRDVMATLLYEQIEQHTRPIKRADLSDDARHRFMLQRKREYMEVTWTRDVWAEEMDEWKDAVHPLPKDIRATFNQVKLTAQNASIMAPILVRREEDKKYDFIEFMIQNWNK